MRRPTSEPPKDAWKETIQGKVDELMDTVRAMEVKYEEVKTKWEGVEGELKKAHSEIRKMEGTISDLVVAM